LLGSFSGVSQGRIRGVNLGLRQPGTEAQRWVRNLRTMKSLAQEFGYEFVGVLQPMLGVGLYRPDEEEQKRILDLKLAENWGPFYDEARRLIKNQKNFYDFVDIFGDRSGLYFDDCHVFAEGDEVIAQRMFDLLKSRQRPLLERSRLLKCRVPSEKISEDRI
ncbi:MAG TPA: hypothetical protein PL182_09615, partial [Pseudobdellovibrionaceae bacterium]|nr:hypothetical protein [Pseudobdellovibrionaceae bacterium]